jgi:type IV fimbrial biogenesis protein FimT
MVVLVLSIALGLGLPSFGELIADQRMRTARSDVTLALAHARSEAVARAVDIVVCPGDERGGCADTLWWHDGWTSFEDRNRNGRRDDGEAALRSGTAPKGVRIATTTGRRLVRYQPDGSSGGSNITLTLCDGRGASRASALAMNNAGRVRRVAVEPGYAAVTCQ